MVLRGPLSYATDDICGKYLIAMPSRVKTIVVGIPDVHPVSEQVALRIAPIVLLEDDVVRVHF
jgi:hypothetical protein